MKEFSPFEEKIEFERGKEKKVELQSGRVQVCASSISKIQHMKSIILGCLQCGLINKRGGSDN